MFSNGAVCMPMHDSQSLSLWTLLTSDTTLEHVHGEFLQPAWSLPGMQGYFSRPRLSSAQCIPSRDKQMQPHLKRT